MNADDFAQKEMPKYRCHKVVHALKLAAIERSPGIARTVFLHPEDSAFAVIQADEDLMSRIPAAQPQRPSRRSADDEVDDPGYFVVYEDGYKSWSPTEAFEKGYARI